MTNPENNLAELRTVALTDSERSAMRQQLRAFTSPHIASRAPSFFARHSALALGMAVILIGGVTSVSANSANPGDALYGFRTHVNDRVQTALTLDDERRLDVELEQIQRMIDGEDSYRMDELSVSADDETDAVETEDREDTPDETIEGADDFDRELKGIEHDLNVESDSGIELE